MSGIKGMRKGAIIENKRVRKINTVFTEIEHDQLIKYAEKKDITRSTAVHDLTVAQLDYAKKNFV